MIEAESKLSNESVIIEVGYASVNLYGYFVIETLKLMLLHTIYTSLLKLLTSSLDCETSIAEMVGKIKQLLRKTKNCQRSKCHISGNALYTYQYIF